MDFNRPMHFIPSPTTPPRIHNFIEIPPPDDFFYPPQQQQHIEAGEQAANNLLMEAQQPMLQPNLQPNQQLNQQPNLPLFWKHQLSQIQQTIALKGQNQLPQTKIRKIIRPGGELKTISSDTPQLFSKAAELMIMEMTLRARFHHANSRSSETLNCSDIARTIRTTDHFRFLTSRVPLEDPPFFLRYSEEELDMAA